MNRRDAYANGQRDFAPREKASFSISPSRYQAKSQVAFRRRKQLLTRLAIAGSLALCLLLFCMPGWRTSFISIVSLGLLSGVEELQLETVRYYDLSNSGGTARGWEREERVLMCAPLRDAEPHLEMFFSHLRNFTYPHHLIDLAFLVSDSKDNTLGVLSQKLTDLQNDPDPKQPFGEISVIEKDFGQKVNQDVESRHGFAAQASRRKLMAQARNWLLSAALRPSHSWVYWRDVDVETAPFTILEDLMRHNKDVIVPNVWRPLPDWLGGEQPYDLNSWQESETALALADTLDEDAVIVEGYAEYATWRPHLAYLRDPYGDPDMEMEIDGVGGVSILAKARVFRSGVHFPAFSFEKHAETEGFGKMAKRMKYSVVGLPHYTVWHLYEPSVDDIRHMEEMEQERQNREREEQERTERTRKIKEEFPVGDAGSQWESDKKIIEKIGKNEEQLKKNEEQIKKTEEQVTKNEEQVTKNEEQIKNEHDAAMAAQGAKDKGDTPASKAEGLGQKEIPVSSKEDMATDGKTKGEKVKDEKPISEKARDEKAKGERPISEKARDEKAKDSKPKEGKTKDEKTVDEKSKDAKAGDKGAQPEKGRDAKLKAEDALGVEKSTDAKAKADVKKEDGPRHVKVKDEMAKEKTGAEIKAKVQDEVAKEKTGGEVKAKIQDETATDEKTSDIKVKGEVAINDKTP